MTINADIIGGTKNLSDGNRIPMIGLGTARNVEQVVFLLRWHNPGGQVILTYESIPNCPCAEFQKLDILYVIGRKHLIYILMHSRSFYRARNKFDPKPSVPDPSWSSMRDVLVTSIKLPMMAICNGASYSMPHGSLYKNKDVRVIAMASQNYQKSIDVSVQAALEAGYRLFDTAEQYANEAELGNALEKNLPKIGLNREDIFITTKVQTKDGDAPSWAEMSVKESLRKLKTNYLDMVLVHYPRDRYTGKDEAFELNKKGRKEVWQKLEELKDQSIIKSIGVSNYEIYHLVELLQYAKHPPVMDQYEFHPYFTRPTLTKFCERNGIFVQAFSSQMFGNKEIQQEEIIKQLYKKYAVSPQIILYAFAVNSGVGIIPKSATPTRILENLHKVAAISFSENELKAMHKLDRNAAFCPGCAPWRCL